MSHSSSIEIDSLFSFSDNNQKQRFEKQCNTSTNVQRYKKKLIQKAYSQIESGLNLDKNIKDVDLKKINSFQLERYDVHSELNRINRVVLEDNLKLVIDCGQDGYKVPHDCGETLFMHHRCGNDKNCFVCNNFASMKRMMSILRILTLLDMSETDKMDFYFALPVLTYPDNYFDTKTMTKEEIYNLIFKHSNQWKKEIFSEHTACVNIPHSWSTEMPLRPIPHFHGHLVISEFVFDPIFEKTIEAYPEFCCPENKPKRKIKKIVAYSPMKKIRFHKTKEELQNMRDVWKKIIGYNDEVNFYYQYTNSRRKLAHYLKYILRGYIQDLNKFLLKIDPDKKILLSPDKEEIVLYHSNFQQNFNRVRWYGFLCNSQRGTFRDWFIPKEIFGILSQLDEIKTICPKCKKEVNFSGANTCRFDDKKMLRVVNVTRLQLELYHQELKKHTFDSRVKMKKIGVEK